MHVHNTIVDTAIEDIHRRFMSHGILFADFAWLDPRNFHQIRATSLPSNELQDLSKCLIKFDSKATVDNLQSELKSLAGQWNRLKASHLCEYKTRIEDPEDGSAGHVGYIVNKSCASRKNCPLCSYEILRWFNMLSGANHLFGLAYKFLLTLSLTQVACERTQT